MFGFFEEKKKKGRPKKSDEEKLQRLIDRFKRFCTLAEKERENTDRRITKKLDDFLQKIGSRSYKCHLCQDRFTMTQDLMTSIRNLESAVNQLNTIRRVEIDGRKG